MEIPTNQVETVESPLIAEGQTHLLIPRFHGLWHGAVAGAISISPDGHIQDLNARAAHLLQRTRSSLRGLRLEELFVLADQARIGTYQQWFSEQSGHRDTAFKCSAACLRPDQSQVKVNVTIRELRVGDDREFLAFLDDRTEHQATLDKLAEATSQLDKVRTSLAVRSAYLEELQNEIQQLKLAVESANRAKSDFLSTVSHELRTPLTAILGFSELIQELSPSSEIGGFAERVEESGRHLLALVDDILDLSRLEAQQTVVVPEAFSPAGVLRELAEPFRRKAVQRGLAFDLVVGPEVPSECTTDLSKYRQVLTNLIANAVKFTESGGILVRLLVDPLPKPPQLRVDVVDTGVGIPPEKQGQIFEPFSLADASASRQYSGTGLGLAICKRYTELLGGQLELTSLPGRGTSVSCWFQYTNSVHVDPRYQHVENLRKVPLQEMVGRTVLIVEDSPDNLYLLRRFVTTAGAKVIEATNGQLSVDRVRAVLDAGERLDAILLDMQMPVMDGYTAAGQIRELGFRGPIVAVTADTTDRARINSLAAGCDAYLSKPVGHQDVVHLLQRLLLLKQHQAAVLDEPLMWE